MTSQPLLLPPRDTLSRRDNAYTIEARSGLRSHEVAHIAKYLRREVRAELKRLAFQLELMRRLDPSGTNRELERFRLAEPLNRAFGLSQTEGDNKAFMAMSPLTSYSARRAMKLMKRRLRNDVCRLVEKAQLLRAMDCSFESDVQQLGLAAFLDTVAAWHRGGDQVLTDRLMPKT